MTRDVTRFTERVSHQDLLGGVYDSLPGFWRDFSGYFDCRDNDEHTVLGER
jgi:hypothetical protein